MKKILYLCSEYPALSHTFIDVEVDELSKNFEIYTSSINYPKNIEKFSDDYVKRLNKTYYIKKENKKNILLIVLKYFIINPLKFINILNYTYNLSVKNGVKNIIKAVGYFIEAILLHNYMKKNNIKHVHIHFANPAATVALIAKEFEGIEYSISVHGPDVFYNVKENLIVEKIKNAKFIRAISYFCQSQLMRESTPDYWDKINIIRCGIDLSKFNNINEFVKEKKENDKINILCVGRIVPSKGQLLLVETVKKVIKKTKNFKVTFIGGGEYLKNLKEKVEKSNLENYIEILGPVNNDKVIKALESSDIFVLPSFAEGVPIVLMEAMSKKIITISTKINGIPELIDDKKDGFLVEASNIDELSELLIEIIKNSDNYKELKNNARKKIEKKYDIRKNIIKLKELFEENISD
ncbi:glycosyltransferase involved in cell wall biosynthesis [Hypnocyclicus thermotrophus]|uniref:Glycosyltransferase involved in cell wall biosynthesis n=1 Tax=Hypnocyclicus thermotrophus TaxID=1627895 RepID=A0AA46I6J0_9FUSO|nr:glycosyltransferase family 4 protein [Hypnocyclicus thermotrophus]TDT72446.1 glycosyltransferase involved in cell wall biosynthesis [Hypnocyclicus thermotrophus]